MRIGISVVMAGRQAAGPETYEVRLVRALAEGPAGHEYTVYCPSADAARSFGLDVPHVRFQVLGPRLRWLSMAVSLPLAARRAGLDVFHATFVPPPFGLHDYVFTMHDDSMFRHPEFYPPMIRWRLQHLVRTGVRTAAVILCISESVRASLVERFAVPPERLAVAYHGVGEEFRPLPTAEATRRVKERYGVDGPFVLFVGRLTARKNPARMLEAFDRVRQRVDRGLKLVLVGNKSWTAEGLDDAMDRLALHDHIVALGHVPDEDLPSLYSAAQMLSFPSLWEGFGLPLVEALACGTPVVTSNLSSLPEIAGGAAVLVDPYSAESIADGMERVLVDGALRQALTARGLERARRFTWTETARDTFEAYERAAVVAAVTSPVRVRARGARCGS